MKKLLIFGGSGLVGTSLIAAAVRSFHVIATNYTTAMEAGSHKSIRLSVSPESLSQVKDVITSESPDVVVNCIAYSDVDFCETNKEEANFLHVHFTKYLTDVCRQLNCKMIYLSSDFVFAGEGKNYTEEDAPKPTTHYGMTKLLAEHHTLNSSGNNVVLRPSVIYGWHPKSRFLHFVIDNLKNNRSVNAFTDQHNNPTLVDDLVECVLKAIEYDAKGIYHSVGSTCLNRFDFATRIAETFSLDASLIIPTKSSEKPQIAKRPLLNCLDNSKASKDLRMHFSTIQEGLQKVKMQAGLL